MRRQNLLRGSRQPYNSISLPSFTSQGLLYCHSTHSLTNCRRKKTNCDNNKNSNKNNIKKLLNRRLGKHNRKPKRALRNFILRRNLQNSRPTIYRRIYVKMYESIPEYNFVGKINERMFVYVFFFCRAILLIFGDWNDGEKTTRRIYLGHA